MPLEHFGIGLTTGTGILPVGTGVTFNRSIRSNTAADWFDSQKITYTGGEIFWNQLADRPELHNMLNPETPDLMKSRCCNRRRWRNLRKSWNYLEKHLNLLRQKMVNLKVVLHLTTGFSTLQVVLDTSAGGTSADTVATDFKLNTGNGFTPVTDIAWDQNASGISFAGYGNTTATMAGG